MSEYNTAPMPKLSLLAEGQRCDDGKALKALLAEAEAYRSPGWEHTQVELRRQLEGHIMPSLEAAAARRFPATSSRMPYMPFNWAAVCAEKGAAVYDDVPQRYVIDKDGAVVVGVEAANFATMLREAHLDTVMPEAERRQYLAESVVLSVRSDSVEAMALGREPRTVVDVFWPADVHVVPHPMAPALLQAALHVLLCLTPDGTTEKTYMHWRRDVARSLDGTITGLGVWRADLVVMKRKTSRGLVGGPTTRDDVVVTSMWNPYPLKTLPLVAWHKGIPVRPFMDGNRNLPTIFNTLNASMMSELHTVDMTSAPLMTRKSAQPAPSQVVIGPGVLVNLLPGEEVQAVTMSADLQGMRETNKAMVQTLGMTLRQPANAFTADRSSIGSGTALKIESHPQEKARREARGRAVPMECEQLLPLMVEVNDYFRATDIAGEAASYSMIPALPPDFESPLELQQRIGEAVDRRWIADARGATVAGWYKDEATARLEIERIRGEVAEGINGLPPIADDKPSDGVDTLKAEDAMALPVVDLAAETTVQDTALNGAQVEALLTLVDKAAARELPAAAVEQLLAMAFPAIPIARIQSLLGSLKGFVPPVDPSVTQDKKG